MGEVFVRLPAAWAIIISAFAVLGIVLFIKLIYDISQSGSKKAVSLESAPLTSAGDEEEIVAVISAAIAAYLDKPSSSIRITSFRRVNASSNPWRSAGIREIMY
ncbi:MAG: hypothetical protein PHF89_01105 [Eubacteriales bacterium]|nr:hypothetical protein [Eubacteriales bacterium]